MKKYYVPSVSDNVVIAMTKKEYSRTGSGKSWKNNPDTVVTEKISGRFYSNYISSTHFFNNYGGHASCRVFYGYTYAGYIPVKVSTVSYDGTKKIIAEFNFTPAGR